LLLDERMRAFMLQPKWCISTVQDPFQPQNGPLLLTVDYQLRSGCVNLLSDHGIGMPATPLFTGVTDTSFTTVGDPICF
jgi:hypothetical protein